MSDQIQGAERRREQSEKTALDGISEIIKKLDEFSSRSDLDEDWVREAQKLGKRIAAWLRPVDAIVLAACHDVDVLETIVAWNVALSDRLTKLRKLHTRCEALLGKSDEVAQERAAVIVLEAHELMTRVRIEWVPYAREVAPALAVSAHGQVF
ncbi:MAG: hypothetical protein EOP08_14785, partial [Proteobacteria bacterium]